MSRHDLPPDALRADVARRLGRVLHGRPEAEVAALVEQIVRTELRWRGPMPLSHGRPERLFYPPLPLLHAPEEPPPEAPGWQAPTSVPADWVEYSLAGAGTVRLPPWLHPTEPSQWTPSVPRALLTWNGVVPERASAARAPEDGPAEDAWVSFSVGVSEWRPGVFAYLAAVIPDVTGVDVTVGGRPLRVTAERLRVWGPAGADGGRMWYHLFGWWALEDGTWLGFEGHSDTPAGQDALLAALRTLRP